MVMGDRKTASLPSAEEHGGGALSVEANERRSKAALSLRKADVAQVAMRLLCMATSVTAVAFMVTAREASTVSIYGFPLPVYSKWSFSDSFE